MGKPCGTISDEHRRKVGEGMRRAWKQRYANGFRPKGPKGQIAEIARILMCLPGNVVENVKWLDENHRKVCANLQERVQKYELGVGGEFVDELICAEFDRLKAGERKP